ncbi:three-helix bundle dimerization domain-containing protein [Geodermatophilus sp. URMC 65]
MSRHAEDELRALEEVLRRLTDRFPEVPAEVVSGIVWAERQRLDGRPIREFMPLLVERASADQLRRRTVDDQAG